MRATQRAFKKGQIPGATDKPKPEMSKEEADRITTKGKYVVFLLCLALEAPKGYVIIPVNIPNKKEYRRIKRQLVLVRKGLRETIWFKNEYKDWQSINCKGSMVLSVSPFSVEAKKIDTPTGKSQIILAHADGSVKN